MTALTVSAGQFAAACLLGMGLGVLYELLRPLRPRFTGISDGLFTAVFLLVWVYLTFGICAGDIRMMQLFGLWAGILALRLTLGKPLQSAIAAIYGFLGRCIGILFRPMVWFLKKIWKILKIIFASVEKSVTIKWRNRRHFRRHSGGRTHGKKKESFQPVPAGVSAQQAFDQGCRGSGHRTVYGSTDLPGRGAALRRKASR